MAPYFGTGTKPVIVVTRYRLDTWQAGERMSPILQEVFETRGLVETPWACFVARRGSGKEDIDFWLDRRGLNAGIHDWSEDLRSRPRRRQKLRTPGAWVPAD